MITYLANPARFLRFSRFATPIAGWGAMIALLAGVYFSLIGSPAAQDHGQNVRMMYVHVPAAWCAMAAYTGIAVASLISFIWRHPLADSAARSLAVPGAAFTFLALVTGSLWGKVAWGTWWQWDGRMTSVLVLFFIYLGYIALWSLIPKRQLAARLAAILAMVGWINIPIIKFSVEWWNSLHQTATISQPGAPGLPSELLLPLLVMALGYTFLLAWFALRGTEAEIVAMRADRKPSQAPATVTLETLSS
ncbi:heme ABC transporter permease CcmC [Litorimonas sp. RW-G-Af-16]|uniref:heme ABC transporter permease CcmC n=1 Tax=Litorimonas sp. RW-G-Af-16 TaxID=3241168 RepID=UPI00390CA33C